MTVRIYLAIVGFAYLFLAAWCTLKPEQTSASVGFTLRKGAGQSEFLTVYGGLELAIGVVFLMPLVRPETQGMALFLCLWIHACLVAFRTLGFVLFREIPAMTFGLAAGEWVIFLLSSWFVWTTPK